MAEINPQLYVLVSANAADTARMFNSLAEAFKRMQSGDFHVTFNAAPAGWYDREPEVLPVREGFTPRLAARARREAAAELVSAQRAGGIGFAALQDAEEARRS